MGAHAGFNSRDLEKLAMLGGSERQSFLKQGPKRAAEPVVRRNIEADLLSVENRRAQFTPHQIPQNHLLPGALNFKTCRKRSGEFHDPVIEKRRPDLNRVRHAGVVDLSQNIVGKKIFLIEPQKGF